VADAPVSPEVMKRAVEHWFSTEFGERARFVWTSETKHALHVSAIHFDTWLDYAMPFCPFEYAAHHFPNGTPHGFVREANVMQKRFDTMLDALGWRAAVFPSDGQCGLTFFPNNATHLGRLEVWGGSAWWPDSEPFVTIVALERKTLGKVLGNHVHGEALRVFEEEEFDTVQAAVDEIQTQEDRYALAQLVRESQLLPAYEELLRDGYYVVDF
jgi:hypothetical protein